MNCASHWLTVDGRARDSRGSAASRKPSRGSSGAERVPQDIEGCITEDGRVWVVQRGRSREDLLGRAEGEQNGNAAR